MTIEVLLLTVLLLITGYLWGRVYTLQKEATETSKIAFFASMYAASEARAVAKSPILRQYVEKYVPVEPDEEIERKVQEKMSKMQKEFEDVWGFPSKKTEANSDGAPFPEDLV